MPDKDREIIESLPKEDFVRQHAEAQIAGEYELARQRARELGILEHDATSPPDRFSADDEQNLRQGFRRK